ncbi:HAD family hydrolase [Pseudogulbenkiania subflava]|uniref:Putative hydrolase of the HAD superfamily n=1 Tax=Pseudogulbenkiania subflava DSM 22618 TaxID=1123014 RepID=A0A1Y6BEM8_9NEIS|nr:HAD family hydrolase [Pseudogulbenkiania subflava]SMF00739.1 putative hydrolase of the HAD superfamily [Pseudogulbenkiania subflava DSM 22618]
MKRPLHLLFDWGDTLMADLPGQAGSMWRWPEVRAMPGAYDTLATLAGRLPCHVATNAAESSADEVRLALARVGLDDLIGRVFCRRELGLTKSDPAFYRRIAAELGVAPHELWMIGDSLANDVHSAQAAGLGAIWLNAAGVAPPPGVQAIAALPQLLELLAD